MSDTDSVSGDVNKPVDNDYSVAQNNLQEEKQQAPANDTPLNISDVLGENTEDSAMESAGDSAVAEGAEDSGKTDNLNNEKNKNENPEDTVADQQAETVENNNDNDITPTASTQDVAVAQGDEQADNAQEDKDDDGAGFGDLGLTPEVLDAVRAVGFTSPSPIQEQTIPLLMAGEDVVGLAQTGTGKTAAFALPILSRLNLKSRKPQALVLAPTRELALQVAESFEDFAEKMGGVNILPIYGGQPYGAQLSGLRRGAHVVVGTPGRVIDHLQKGSLDISELRFMVLDEADEMLNMGFQEDVERILEDTPEEKQVALFSATMPSAIRHLSKRYLNEPQEVTVKSTQRTAENIEQDYLIVHHREKLDALTRILEVTDFDAMIMFVRTKNDTEELAERLRARGFEAAAINGDIAQAQRERTVDQLKDGRLDILVATDVAARGLDVERITHVFNYDIPRDTESYVHRIGRTGRAGRSGRAVLFVTPRERRMLKSIERATKSRLNEIELPSVDQVNEARKAKFNRELTKNLEDPQVSVFRELVTTYAEENGVTLEDIAAALAAGAQGGEKFLMEEAPRREHKRRSDDRYGDADRRGGGAYRSFKERFNKPAPRFTDRNGNEMEVYRLSVGHRQRVRPGAIVGALANEGGLNSRDFGRISIFSEHSLVELPADLPKQVFEALDQTRVSGQLINIEPDPGAPKGRPGSHRGNRRDRDDRRGGYRDDRGRGDRRGGGRFDRDRDRGGRGRGRGHHNRFEDSRGDRRGGGRHRDDRGFEGRGGRGDKRRGGRY